MWYGGARLSLAQACPDMLTRRTGPVKRWKAVNQGYPAALVRKAGL